MRLINADKFLKKLEQKEAAWAKSRMAMTADEVEELMEDCIVEDEKSVIHIRQGNVIFEFDGDTAELDIREGDKIAIRNISQIERESNKLLNKEADTHRDT